MRAKDAISALPIKALLPLAMCLVLVGVAAGCGNAARTTITSGARATTGSRELARSSQVRSSSACKSWSKVPSTVIPTGLVPKRPILAGPVSIMCGVSLGEPVRLVAYVEATAHGGKQLCYVLEQRRQSATVGGSCIQMVPAMTQCANSCPLIVEATPAIWGKEESKGSLVTAAAVGLIEEVTLSTAPVGNKKVTRPLIVVLGGAAKEKLRLPSVVSFFVSIVIPCLPPNQTVFAESAISGKGVTMQGSDPFGCRG